MYKFIQEAEGWPSHVKTEADREKYLKTVLEKEGLQLDPKNIEKNPGRRALAKLMLVSFWGKVS